MAETPELARDGRAGELDWWHAGVLCPHPTPGVCALVTLLDVELRARGYVHTHPVRHRLLTGPLGDTVDVVELAGRIERGLPYPFDLGGGMAGSDPDADARRLAGRRFPGTRVAYRAADLLDPPAGWREAFDLVVEVMTVQSLPEHLHGPAVERVAGSVRPGGTLVVIASARDEEGPVFAPPWPLTPAEIGAFAGHGLVADRIEDLREPERRRWRATFRRPSG